MTAAELPRLMQVYNDANKDARQRNTSRRVRIAKNQKTDEDEVLPRPPEITDAYQSFTEWRLLPLMLRPSTFKPMPSVASFGFSAYINIQSIHMY
eukprot:4467092-Amphidinium_carterae.1